MTHHGHLADRRSPEEFLRALRLYRSVECLLEEAARQLRDGGEYHSLVEDVEDLHDEAERCADGLWGDYEQRMERGGHPRTWAHGVSQTRRLAEHGEGRQA